MEALIYTRPYSTDNGLDYCCFCRPSSLSDKEFSEVLRHARNVMNTEIDGNIQNECRWHILRISDYVLVGVATTRFGRKDQVNRSIRGYYGVLMPKDSAFVPSWKSFAHLDATYVTPLFDAKQPFSPVTPACVDGVGISPDESEDEFNTPLDFNFAKDKIKIMPVPEMRELPSLLKNALECAKIQSDFNFVYGLNTKVYASSKPFMNAFCYNVQEVSLIALKSSPMARESRAFESKRCSNKPLDALSCEDERPLISCEMGAQEQGKGGKIWMLAGCTFIGACLGLAVMGKPVVALISGVSGGIMLRAGKRRKHAQHRERAGIIQYSDNHAFSNNSPSEELRRFGFRAKEADKQDTPNS